MSSNSRGRDKLRDLDEKKTKTQAEAVDHQAGRIVSQAGPRLAERNLTKEGGEKKGHVRYMSVPMGKVERD